MFVCQMRLNNHISAHTNQRESYQSGGLEEQGRGEEMFNLEDCALGKTG